MVVLFLVKVTKSWLHERVEPFFQALLRGDTSRKIVTRNGMCQARKILFCKIFIGFPDLGR